MEKTISERPPNKNESAKRTDKVSSEVTGEVNATILTTINKIPTNRGICQCLMEFFIEFKNNDCIILIV